MADRVQNSELVSTPLPALWCPLLTHYAATGAIDRERMGAHFRHVSQWVRGFLIPGSTGDGWELTDEETRAVMDFAVGAAQAREAESVDGDSRADSRGDDRPPGRDGRLAATHDPHEQPGDSPRRRAVRGFAVCPPTGADLSEQEIEAGLARVLDMGLPTALYQLPQVTHNEMSPELVARLATRYPRFFLLKDSSGTDRIALSAARPRRVRLVRGAEGNYARWLKGMGGPYEGLLLSTANCFAEELAKLVAEVEAGETAGAEARSQRLTQVVQEVFELVAGLPSGNAFANANKAMDHCFAYGPAAEEFDSPLLHAGLRLPPEVILATKEILLRSDLLPARISERRVSPVAGSGLNGGGNGNSCYSKQAVCRDRQERLRRWAMGKWLMGGGG